MSIGTGEKRCRDCSAMVFIGDRTHGMRVTCRQCQARMTIRHVGHFSKCGDDYPNNCDNGRHWQWAGRRDQR